MRVALLSDIHGNGVALDAVLADLQHSPVDQVVCLGDAIQGGPQPAEVVAQLRALACPVVMGNADDWLLSGVETGAEAIPAEHLRVMHDIRAWSLSQLTPEDQAFIAQFQPTVTVLLPSQRTLLCYHGSPHSYDDVILPTIADAELQRLLEPQDHIIYTGGHTHVQFLRHMHRTFHINPGSVGLAYRHGQPEHSFQVDPWAEYAILTVDDARIAVEFRRVPFDVQALIAIYTSSGRPHPEQAIRQYQP
ncbi:MAG TPA: metallophosphoesterase family protein [Herpetosiphonaceae bacterium]